MAEATEQSDAPELVRRIFPGESTAAALLRATDWSATPIGDLTSWPQSLRAAVGLMLHSRFPMVLFWGRELVMLYNDGYSALIGDKHPAALGRPASEVLPEIWSLIGPMLEGVLERQEATWSHDELILLRRHGYLEEAYFTFAFSVTPDDAGAPGGVFCVATETTERVRGERRLTLLRELSAAAETEPDAAAAVAVATLGGAALDITCTVLALGSADGSWRYVEPPGHVIPPVVRREVERAVQRAADERAEQVLAVPAEACPEVVAIPLARPADPGMDVLVLGRSPRIALDEDYRAFFRLAAAHVGTELANARAHDAERRRAETLAELDRAKTAFFSNVSHEFRTPLTLMLGPVEDLLAERHGALTEGQRNELEIAHRSSLRLLRLVNTLLEFSRIEAGRVQATYRRTDLPALTAELASTFRAAVERAGLRLSVDTPPLPAGVEAWVDRTMWEQIVLNLLSNALKFTMEGEIAIALGTRDGEFELLVRDTGTGVPAHELPHLFERFHRVRGAAARTHEGTGIGLALVRELARLHGGNATVDSEEGRGTAVRVTIPAGRGHLPAGQVSNDPGEEDGQESATWGPQARTIGDAAAATVEAFIDEALGWLVETSAPTGATGRRGRVLLADDNADMRAYLGRLLRSRHAVTAVGDGRAALEAALANPPDLVLADVMMPGLDGFGLLAELRARERTRDIPVVLLSARAGEEARIEGIQAGADDYLVKPFTARELLARVDGLLELQRVRREAAERARAARIAAEESDERARLAIAVAGLGTWRYEPGSGVVEVDDRMREIWGGTPRSIDDALDRVLEDDRARVASAVQAAMDPTGSGDYDVEFRIAWPDGSTRWIHANGRAQFDGEGSERHVALLVGTALDISTRKVAEEALRESERRLRDALAAKDEFLGLVSHELRTPMTVILGMSRLLERPDADAARAREVAGDIFHSAEALNSVVESMLLLARLDGEEAARLREPVLITRVAEKVLADHRQRDGSRPFELQAHARDLLVDIQYTLVERLIDNLVGNAAKYSAPGGAVTVLVERGDGEGCLRVLDEGPSPSEGELERLFEPFYRSTDARIRAPGAGLGLAVAKRIVELTGGRIWACRRDTGGSEFGFALPLIEHDPDD